MTFSFFIQGVIETSTGERHGRHKLELNDAEKKLLASIPSAKKAQEFWSRFQERKIQAQAGHLTLGNELAAVRDKLEKRGGNGLCERWLQAGDASAEDRPSEDDIYGFYQIEAKAQPGNPHKRQRVALRSKVRLN
jgi:hypothetical protein